jgi:hypothetical protein
MPKVSNEQVITLTELKSTPEWNVLNPKQRLFVETFIVSGDVVFATQTAYETKSPKVARVFSYELMSKLKIRRVLNRYFGKPDTDLDDVMPKLLRAIKKSVKRDLEAGSISATTVRAMEFYERATGQRVTE